MFKRAKRVEAGLFLRVWRRAAEGKLEKAGWRLLLLWLLSVGLAAVLPGNLGQMFAVLAWLFGIPLAWCVCGLALRFILQRVLWTVRSRLVVTCLLMGLAPIVLFLMLSGIAGYVFCGQFATSVAIEGMKDGAAAMQDRSREVLARVSDGRHASAEGIEGGFAMAWRDGAPLEDDASDAGEAAVGDGPLPGWVKPDFHGAVGAAGKLYLCGTSGQQASGHSLLVLVCSPFRKAEAEALAEGLGEISVTPNLSGQTMPAHPRHGHGPHVPLRAAPADEPARYAWVQGGKLRDRLDLFDVRVYFSAPLATISWETGERLETFLNVVSRPSLLYRKLFANSVTTARVVSWVLIGTAIFFAVLEALAVGMALLVSRTITRSVADLYGATQAIDRGDLNHLIPVRRKDQLSALAASFNGMTASLRKLLEEQREKQRMESELNVAQEVQRNLFPHTAIDLPELEVYGTCEPARTIGGDYYDFIPFGGCQIYLSLGDISGKGISAALLMASLHSAVRAYRAAEGQQEVGVEESLSPGRLLGLLNRHLFTSTQPAKYATLFLASYDCETRRLTYANGGHPPPVVLRADGSVRRLECGGCVVGLLEGMVYEEETVELGNGDLLMAYSDGLSEPERDGEDFGEARLIEVVRRNAILPLGDIAGKTLGAVREWIGDEEQPDDMTLVLARVV
jgi:sigma-B regulation protein RsbU (phosphoserine phosphatase)